MAKIKAALVGCGAIAHGMHLPGIKALEEMGKAELVAVADTVVEKARSAAEKFNVPHHYADFAQMLADADFDLLVNTTIIPSHFAVTRVALRAGKHVYTQKPMTTTVDEATELIETAREHGVQLSSAPEHPVRPHVRALRKLIEAGAIGKVTFAKVRTSHGGPEKHYNPDAPRDSTWYYKPGSDPVLDLGVHGLSQITSVLGPVRRIAAMSGRSLPVRYITEGPLADTRIDVEIDDNTLLLLDFGEARFAFLDATYCVQASLAPHLEIFGSEGTLAVTMNRSNGREIILHHYSAQSKEWRVVDVPPTPPVRDLGVLHMVDCLLEGREPILSGDHGRHLVEIMTKAPVAAQEGRTLELETIF